MDPRAELAPPTAPRLPPAPYAGSAVTQVMLCLSEDARSRSVSAAVPEPPRWCDAPAQLRASAPWAPHLCS